MSESCPKCPVCSSEHWRITTPHQSTSEVTVTNVKSCNTCGLLMTDWQQSRIADLQAQVEKARQDEKEAIDHCSFLDSELEDTEEELKQSRDRVKTLEEENEELQVDSGWLKLIWDNLEVDNQNDALRLAMFCRDVLKRANQALSEKGDTDE